MADAIGQFFDLEDFLGVVKDLSFCVVGSATGHPFACVVVGDPERCGLFRMLVHTAFGEYYGARVVVFDFATEEEAREAVGPEIQLRRCTTNAKALEIPPAMFGYVAPLVMCLLVDTFRAHMHAHVNKTMILPLLEDHLAVQPSAVAF